MRTLRPLSGVGVVMRLVHCSTMKAILISRLGGPEVLQAAEVPDPIPAAGQVLVRVKAGGINFADIMTAQGGYPGAPRPPIVAGREFSGVREDNGQHVMGYAQWAAFAEHIATGTNLLWPVPEGWSAEEGAAFPVNYFTAYLAYWKADLLEKSASVGRQRVLIHAVAGGVGTAAVQIGKLLRLEMYGTSSTDIYGSATGRDAQLDTRALYAKGGSVHGLWLTYLSAKRDLMDQAWKQLSAWTSQGHLRPVIGNVLPMERAAEAYRLLLERKNFGKVVLQIA